LPRGSAADPVRMPVGSVSGTLLRGPTMKRYIKNVLVVCSLSMLAVAVFAADENKEKSDRAERRKARATSRPAYLDKEHAPRGRGWVHLFNGKDLDGWKFFPSNQPTSWKATDGVMASVFKEGEHGVNAYTAQQYTDFEFYCEFKVPKNGNSGIFLRGLFEIQIRGDYGMKLDDPGIDWGTGAFYGQKKPLKNASKPDTEWQSVFAKVVGDKATVYVNGELVQENYVLAKATHRYGEMKDVKEAGPGPIILQGDHKPIEYRHVMLKPLDKAEKTEKTEKTETK
jgi:hypothetical protein